MRARIGVIAALVAACTGPVTPPPVSIPPAATPERPTPSASVEPTETAQPAVAPTPTEAPASPGCGASGAVASLELMLACTMLPEPREVPAPVTALESWTYVKSDFTPTITFSVGRGWTAAQATEGFFDIQDKPNSLDVVAVQFGNVAEADTADEAAANVAARPNLSVSQPEDVTIDGIDGIHLVVETTDSPDTDPPVFRPVIELTPGDVSIASARRLDLTLLDVGGDVLAVMVGGSIAKWHRALRLGTPVIESVQIGD